jgi:A/G-specific adenine glycosylase
MSSGAILKPRWKHDVLEGRVKFRAALVAWFSENGRDYPWRRTQEAYPILVSEVMLQQTQIATVLGRGFYSRFLERFPTVEDLANAEEDTLLKAWEGLGYYRRVRMLRETARAVVEQGGGFPQDLPALLKLPGIGQYTAGALRAFAWNLPAVVVDGNVLRVLARLMDFSGTVDETAGSRQLWAWAETLADPRNSRLYHSGLMELGQRICRPGLPDCLNCPISGFCKTRSPELLPVKKPKAAATSIEEHGLWLRDAEGRILLHREGGKRREGLWKLPTREAVEIEKWPVVEVEEYTITRYRVRLHVHEGGRLTGPFTPATDEVWVEPTAVMALAMPAPFRRVIGRLLGDL